MTPTIADSTLGGDIAKGWGFHLKQPNGFAEHGCTVVSASDGYPTRSGDYSLRFEVREGDCGFNDSHNDCETDRSRHELSQDRSSNASQYDGDEYWYGWSEYLPTQILVQGTSRTFLGQFQSPSGIFFLFEDFREGLGYRFRGFANRKVLVENASVRGIWTDILMHVRWSTSDDGLIEVYLNGNLVETLVGPTMDGVADAYFSFGIYNAFISRCECDVMPIQVVYYDALARGKSREEVEPGN